MAISFACGNCGKAYKVDDKFAGKKAACKACGTINLIPGAAPQSASPARSASVAAPKRTAKASTPPPIPVDHGFDFDALEHAASEADSLSEGAPPPVPARRGAPASACPGCGGPLEPGAVFCTGCGYNLRTGKQVSTKVLAPEKVKLEMVAAPKRATASASAGGGGGGGETPGFAVGLIILGAGSALLPLMGLQFRVLAPLGPYAPIAGAGLAFIGALVCLIKGSWGWAIGGGGATLMALILFFTVGISQGRSSDDGADNESKPELASSKARRITSPARNSSSTSNDTPSTPSTGDFFWEGQPKIKARSSGTALFTMVSYEAIRLPQGQDLIEFFRPALIQDSADVRLAGLDIIHKGAGSSRAADVAAAAAQCIDDGNPAVRGEALKLQGLVKNEQTVANVNKRIGDENPEIRKEAIRIALRFRDPSSVEPLLARLDDDPSLQSSLMTFSPEARETIQKRISEKMTGDLTAAEPHLRRRALSAIIAANPNNCGEQIMVCIDDADPSVRGMAMAKLASLKYEPAMEKIAARLDDPAAAGHLAAFGKSAEAVVLPKASDGNPKIRAAALHLLANIGSDQALELAKTAARDEDLLVSNAGRAVWQKLAPNEVAPSDMAMLDLESTDEKKRLRGLHALKDLKPDKHQAAVAKKAFDLMIETPEGFIPTVAKEVLVIWADPLTRDALLMQVTPDNDDAKRMRSIDVLRQLKDSRVIAPAAACLAAGKRGGVIDALRSFGSASEDELIKILRNDDIFIVKEVCDLLKEVGTKKSLQPLGLIALDQRSGARDAAREAASAINKRLSGKG